MAPAAEAQIARELMKFAATGQLYRGSKPVMWSVVEKTALAEAEIEYHDYTSDTVWVKFPVVAGDGRIPEGRRLDPSKPMPVMQPMDLRGASIVIWTTTPWTIPGNRAISYSEDINYGLYEVTDAPADNWVKAGEKLIVADELADAVFKAARIESKDKKRLDDVPADVLADVVCAHPLRGKGYDFDVPLLEGDHVTDEDGTGFVHTAPGHGRDDFEIWMAKQAKLIERGISPDIPFTVDADGAFTREASGFEGKRVLKENGDKGDANDAVIKALQDANALIARGRLKHQYPHSWRSKKPVIFRNTPQWFIAMDRPIGGTTSAAVVPSPLVGEGQGGGDSRTSNVGIPPTPNPSPRRAGGAPSARRGGEFAPASFRPPLTPPPKGEGHPVATPSPVTPCASSRCVPSAKPNGCRRPARTALPA
jgi:isoleucyl-tRNA synthetase